MCELRRFVTSGTPASMGEQFGEEFREDIRELAESRLNHLVTFVRGRDSGRAPSRQAVLSRAAETVEAHALFAPDIWAEFRGIALAAGLRNEELLVANGLTDLRDFVLLQEPGQRMRTGAHVGECSAFIVPGCLASGSPIVGQTWDMNQDAVKYIVVVRRRPHDSPETLGLTTVGCLSLIGTNSEGVSVGNTNLVPVDARPGVNYLFTITRALQARSAAEAAESIEQTPRLSGHNFYVADEHQAINLETTAIDVARTDVDDSVFVHTNHYLDPVLQQRELASANPGNSQWRQHRLSENFRELPPPISMVDAWRQLADNTRGDGAVCNEDWHGRYGEACTVATVVQHPVERTIWVCAGGARLGSRVEIAL